MTLKFIPAAIAVFAVSLGAGSAIGANHAIGDLRIADPTPQLMGALSVAVVEVDAPAWAEDRLLVAMVAGSDVDAIAGDYKVEVLNSRGGYAALSVPEHMNRDAFMARIRDDQRVIDVSREPAVLSSNLDGMVGW